MKKIIYLLAILILGGCAKDFLTLYPKTSLNEDNFYKTESDFVSLANGCYVPMRDYTKKDSWSIGEVISDNSSFQYNPTDAGSFRVYGVIDLFLVTPDNAIYTDFWEEAYNGITRCNKTLAEINKSTLVWPHEQLKERSIGEALFLRALYYFDLVRQFGGVPLVLKPVSGQEAVAIKRSSQDSVYLNIINDLNDAATHFSAAKGVEENGRADLGATNALLGKVYLTLRKYAKADSVLKIVIDSHKYELLPNYADLFNPAKKDFKETIFSIQYSENSQELSNRFIFIFAPSTSLGEVTQRPNISITGSSGAPNGWNQPTPDLINAFEAGDKRKSVSIGFWTGLGWDGLVQTFPYCSKYKPPISSPADLCGDNFPILRYSDVLLMYAEALNGQNMTSQAIPYVEQVRSRAGLTDPLTGLNKETLDSLIAKERQKEFCFENQRWFDLKRTGKALAIMSAHGEREKVLKPLYVTSSSYEMSQDKLLAPIPALEVLVNKLQQNPGY